MNFGLTLSEEEQLISLLDKIQTNHCKNYDTHCSYWHCTSKLDNKACPIEYEICLDLETNGQGWSGCFYCPVFIIRNVLEEK